MVFSRTYQPNAIALESLQTEIFANAALSLSLKKEPNNSKLLLNKNINQF